MKTKFSNPFTKLKSISRFLCLLLFFTSMSGITEAATSMLWGIKVTNRVARPSNTIYANDPIPLMIVSKLDQDLTSEFEYTNAGMNASGKVVIGLKGNTLDIEFDLNHTYNPGSYYLGRVRLMTIIEIIPFAPLGDYMHIDIDTNYETDGFLAKRKDGFGAQISDFEHWGESQNYYYYDTITHEGVEYGRMFENYNRAYSNFYFESTEVLYYPRNTVSNTAKGFLTVEANNLTNPIPEPNTTLLALTSLLMFTVRRKR